MGLRAALALARGRADGVRLLDVGPADAPALAGYSFIAAPICLPAFAGMRGFDWLAQGAPAGAWHGAAVGFLGFVVGWAGFALVSHRLAALLHRPARWPRFIAVWNWCNVLQNVAMLAALVPVAFGLPAWVNETVWLVAIGWALWLEWFATCAALEIPGLPAAGLVALDLAIGLVVEGITGP
jgi:hypothetical protein